MKKIISTTLLALFLSAGLVGCAPEKEMTRKEVISAVKECEDAGMKATLYMRWNNQICKVNCTPFKATAD